MHPPSRTGRPPVSRRGALGALYAALAAAPPHPALRLWLGPFFLRSSAGERREP